MFKKKKMKRSVEAKDAGGPTRVFLQEVWRQMGQLTVKNPANQRVCALFNTESFGGLCIPSTDCMVMSKLGLLEDPERARDLVKSHCRALGRIFLWCIANCIVDKGPDGDIDYQYFPIASHAMPNIYKNYFLRGIDPLDRRYPLGELLHEVTTLKWSKAAGNDRLEESMTVYIDTLDVDVNELSWEEQDVHNKFRITAHDDFITSRSFVVQGIKEGITLQSE